jgi:hypothetical protein
MSGWRAALVALAVGGLVLGIGWVVASSPATPGATTPATTGQSSGSEVTLLCPVALDRVCEELSVRLAVGRDRWQEGTPPADHQLVVAPSAELDGATLFARSPVAIAVWHERSRVLVNTCGGTITPICLVEHAGDAWSDLGGPTSWGQLTLGLADPASGTTDQEAWRLFSDLEPGERLGRAVRLVAEDDGRLMADLVLFPSRADVVVTSEVAIASQYENARTRAGLLDLFYPDPAPWIDYGVVSGDGREARRVAEQLTAPEVQAILGSLGIRPVVGEVGELMEGLGQPGTPLPPLDAGQIGVLISSWEEARR